MKRALVGLAALALLPLAPVTRAASAPGLLAGASVVDATWHVGASAGQYASTQDPSLAAEWDPNLQHVKNAASYGVASRLSVRALVLRNPGQPPVALVKDDNYLSQDMLVRRAAQILAAEGSEVTYDHLLVSATHDHNSPYYATPAAGVWLFQDAMRSSSRTSPSGVRKVVSSTSESPTYRRVTWTSSPTGRSDQ